MLTTQPKKKSAANIEQNTCELRKHFRQFDNTHAANAHNTTKKEMRCKYRKKNTCKLRKHFRQFDNTHAANAHNTTKKETRCKYRKKHLQIKKTLWVI